MLNKFYKTIHNRYSRFFEFIFFLRYLLLLFLISIAVFLIIPVFFNYEKKAEIIKLHLLENYNYEISSYEKIKYNFFPLPKLEISNILINLNAPEENLNVKKIIIYPELFSIYNFQNFSSNKVTLKDSNLEFKISNFGAIIKKIFYKKNKLYINNLNLKIFDEKIPVITLSNINFSNYGYNENLIKGKVFDKNFKVELNNNYRNINFELLNSGINANINFEENQAAGIKLGTFKSKILNANFKSNFKYDGKIIKIYNSYFRSKNIYLRNKSDITLHPFLDTKTEFVIEEFNSQILKKIELIKFLSLKDFLRKINNKSEVNFKPKKINRKFFDDLNLEIDLAYGRMNYSKKLMIANNMINCNGSINFLEEYPLLFFHCNVKSEDKKELFKKFSIKTKKKNEIFELRIKGNLNILNRKVNFKNISVNDSYEASKEDLKYFKSSFEKIFFDKSFLEIFDSKKLKEFILEIS